LEVSTSAVVNSVEVNFSLIFKLTLQQRFCEMNSELKYVAQGCLLAIVFLIAAFVVKFSFSYTGPPQKSDQIVTIDPNPAGDSATSAGRTLFITNCASCHAINKKLTGPALYGVIDRVQDKNLLYEWIRNNKKVLKSGNAYFNSLYIQYDRIEMNLFPNLIDADIEAILSYISAGGAKMILPSRTAYIQ
jgi:mono/diheme cytochrome c family protein